MDKLVDEYFLKAITAIRACAALHPDAIFSAFAFFEDVSNGIFAAGFDTIDNSLVHAKQQESSVREIREMAAAREGRANFCENFVENRNFLIINDFNNSFSDFKYPGILHDRVIAWIDDPVVTSGYLLCLAWRVIDSMVDAEVFRDVRLAAPFRLCFMTIDRDDAIVLRILNWPSSRD